MIADRITDNIRTLEGALIRVIAIQSLTGHHWTPRSFAPSSTTFIPRPSRRDPPIDAIQEAVAAHFGSRPTTSFRNPHRTHRVATPLAIVLSRDLTGHSLAAIGAAFGGRNHATVLHACRRVAERTATTPMRDGTSTNSVTALSARGSHDDRSLLTDSDSNHRQLPRILRPNERFSTAVNRTMTSNSFLRYSL